VAPGAVLLVDDEGLAVAGAVRVGPACAAVAGRGARDRVDVGTPARVEARRVGDLLGVAPGAVILVDDEGLVVAGAVLVGPAGAAVDGRAARDRGCRGTADP